MKFFNKKVKYDGHVFDSTAEMERYKTLLGMQKQGIILNLEIQKQFEIIPKLLRKEIVHLKTKDKVVFKTDELPAHYTCDFFYFDCIKQKWIVEELKSKQTAKLADYILRRKLIKKKIKEMNESSEDMQYQFLEIISQPIRKRKTKNKK